MEQTRNDLARVVAERLRALKVQGVTEEQVGARSSPPLKQDYVNKVANGVIPRPGDERLAALAVGLGLPAEALREARDRPRADPSALLPRLEEARNHLSASGVVTPEDVRDVDADFAATLYRIEQEARRRRAPQ